MHPTCWRPRCALFALRRDTSQLTRPTRVGYDNWPVLGWSELHHLPDRSSTLWPVRSRRKEKSKEKREKKTDNLIPGANSMGKFQTLQNIALGMVCRSREHDSTWKKFSSFWPPPPPFFLNSQLVSPRSNSLQIEVFLWAVNPSLRCRATKEEGSGVLASPRPFFNCDYYFFLSQQLTSLTIQLIEECEPP